MNPWAQQFEALHWILLQRLGAALNNYNSQLSPMRDVWVSVVSRLQTDARAITRSYQLVSDSLVADHPLTPTPRPMVYMRQYEDRLYLWSGTTDRMGRELTRSDSVELSLLGDNQSLLVTSIFRALSKLSEKDLFVLGLPSVRDLILVD